VHFYFELSGWKLIGATKNSRSMFVWLFPPGGRIFLVPKPPRKMPRGVRNPKNEMADWQNPIGALFAAAEKKPAAPAGAAINDLGLTVNVRKEEAKNNVS
jgi:hypothetical protein